MKNLLIFIAIFLPASSFSEEIDIICHCVNDCVREKMCDGVFEKYVQLTKTGSDEIPKTESEFLSKHKLSSLEFVDWGVSQCGTVYGVVGEVAFRYDFELNGSQVTKSALSKVSSIPTIIERKSAKIEDLCVFRL